MNLMRTAVRNALERLLSAALVFGLLSACAPKAERESALSPTAAQIATLHFAKFDSAVAADDVGGMTVAIVKNGRVALSQSFGWADKAQKIPANENTIYRIGSISKSVTAVAMMQLVDQGVFALDDPVENYFPEIKNLHGYDKHPPVTFRQLASHTAGLIREPLLFNAAAGPISEWENKILASIPATSFPNAPGEKYQYSNIGYGILGLAIARAADKPFMDLVQEQTFDPLEMTSSAFILPEELQDRLAVGYANRGDSVDTALPAKEHAGRGYKVPNGGVYTTVGDLANWISSLCKAYPHRLMLDGSLAEIMKIQTPEDSTRGYGLGFSIRMSENGLKIVGHGGSVAGYNVYHAFDPASTIGVILFRNYNRGALNLGQAGTDLLREIIVAEAQK